MYYAHSLSEHDKKNWQVLSDHLSQVADLAGGFGEPIGIARACHLAGLLHDLGKYTPEFQARLDGSKVPAEHAIDGAFHVMNLSQTPDDKMVTELVAYAIAGHHAGLADMINMNTPNGTLSERLRNYLGISLSPIWSNEIKPDANCLLPKFDWHKVDKTEKNGTSKLAFQFSILGRMIFSCLVDADFKDTEAFYKHAEGLKADRSWPSFQEILPNLLDRYNGHMNSKATTTSKVGVLRGDILNHVRSCAGMTPGLFTLTVPTGGGKTLASLGFALDHAKAHGHSRIIYAIPFTSIIDQTVDVFTNVLGGEFILEHHSAIDEEKIDLKKSKTGKDKLKLAMEDWAAPIVVTTNVQLFESLFAARGSRARKLHNIAGSIIILDEAQTLPRHLLTPSVRVLDELARNYGCTIILCTATQPALDERNFPKDHPMGLALEGRELAPDPHRLALDLKRVTIARSGQMSDEDLVAALTQSPQALVIVNSRKHALALYRLGKDAGLEGIVHLTTRQYAAHRREILAKVRIDLQDVKACRVIATSLVEAGVDLDFPRVWRAETGLDQVAQAAGRCNREGTRPVEQSIVTVFASADHKPPAEIRQLAADFARMADKHDDFLSPDAMTAFFGEVYWRLGKGLDAKDILDDFKIGRHTDGSTNFAYRSVAEKYRMIESGMVPIIIARDDKAKEAIEKLKFENIPSGSIARELQTFVVQVPPIDRAKMIDNGHVKFEQPVLRGDQFAVLQTQSLYTDELGLLWEDADYLGLIESII